MEYNVRIAESNVEFVCSDIQTVLEGALKSGIEIPYSCMKGVCGSCQASISEAGRSDGLQERLLCQVRPQGDLTIWPQSWRLTGTDGPKSILAKVHRKEAATPDITILHLRLPMGERAKFRPGQYLKIVFPDGDRRSYSIANAPHQNDVLTLHVRHVDGGRFTALLSTLDVGMELEIELPFGNVDVSSESSRPLLCVATGTGMAPVKSLLDHLIFKRTERPVDVIWGVRRMNDFYLPSALASWKKKLPKFRFFPVVRHEDSASPAAQELVVGRVDDAIAKCYQSLGAYDVYCCGSSPMVETVRRLTVDHLGLNAHDFFADSFVASGSPGIQTL